MTATTVAGVIEDQLADHVREYRQFVLRAVRREQFTAADVAEVGKLLRHLGLPGYAWRRDRAAAAESATARGHRLAELAVLHPHLFDDPAEWVRRRLSDQRALRS